MIHSVLTSNSSLVVSTLLLNSFLVLHTVLTLVLDFLLQSSVQDTWALAAE